MDTGHFTRLSGDECGHLLRGHSVGRVSWASSKGLQVLPVSYVASGGLLYFRTNPDSVMGELAGPIDVAFEVDDIDVSTATGWSVLVQGEARAHDDSTSDLRIPDAWAPGERALTVVITPSACSGRAVSAAHPRS
jgi:nitroimidazol reductase NimA-like FMN-containing flavoprotein (pyridoxamine 5'-phosphate oxidase superfamily)